MFLRVMQWSNHCVPWQIGLVGALFGLRPLLFVLFVLLAVSLFSLAKRKSGWGDLWVVVFWWSFVFFWLFYFDLPAYMDQLCPCTNVF